MIVLTVESTNKEALSKIEVLTFYHNLDVQVLRSDVTGSYMYKYMIVNDNFLSEIESLVGKYSIGYFNDER